MCSDGIRGSMGLSVRTQSARGIGLVEVLVTAFILSILVIASLRISSTSTRVISENSDSLAETMILASAMELGYYSPDQTAWNTRLDSLNLARPSTEFTVSDIQQIEASATTASEVALTSPSRLSDASLDSRRLKGANLNASAVGSVVEINRLTEEAASSSE